MLEKEMTFDQLVTSNAGYALQSLGQGTSMRSICFEAMRSALQWLQDKKKDEAKALIEQEKPTLVVRVSEKANYQIDEARGITIWDLSGDQPLQFRIGLKEFHQIHEQIFR